MNAKHTPGPWAIGNGGMHVYYVNPHIEAGNESIDDPRHDSVVAQCDNMGAFSGIPDEERQANARLIAAAPETYAVFRRLASFAEAHCADTTGDSGLSALVAEARAVIAKVEGATECNPQPSPNP